MDEDDGDVIEFVYIMAQGVGARGQVINNYKYCHTHTKWSEGGGGEPELNWVELSLG